MKEQSAYTFDPNKFPSDLSRFSVPGGVSAFIQSFVSLQSGTVELRHMLYSSICVTSWLNVQHLIAALDLGAHWPTILAELRRFGDVSCWENGVRWMPVHWIVNAIVQYIPYTDQFMRKWLPDVLTEFALELYRSEGKAVATELRRIFDEQGL